MEHDERACRALLQRWHREGDRAARDEVAERLLPLAHGLARRYAGKGEPLDDLEQVACVGLLKAIDRFDCAREVRSPRSPCRRSRGRSSATSAIAGGCCASRARSRSSRRGSAGPREELTRLLGRPPRVEELAARRRRDAGAGRRGAARRGGLPRDVARRAHGRGRAHARRGAGRRRRRVRAHGAAAPAARRLRGARAARARDPAPALLRGAHAARDRRPRRDQPDARLAPDPPVARPAAHRDGRAGRVRRGPRPRGPAACRRWPPPLDG